MKEKPDVMNKIYPVWGDLPEPDFNLNPEHLKRVLENTQIVFHFAASLKNEAPLRPNVLMNLVGTKNALELAKKMRNLIQMIHLSTAFCIIEPVVVYEKPYPFHHDPEDLISLASWMDDKAMEIIQKDLMGNYPNTYIYTKRLAEILVEREYANLPICIVRPTIVLPTYNDPFPGWVDSMNGLVGIVIAAGKGVLRSLLADPDVMLDFIPVDMAISGIILIAKSLATTERAKEIPVIHTTSHDLQKITTKKLFDLVRSIGRDYPVSWPLW